MCGCVGQMISFHSPIRDRPSISRFHDHCFSVVLPLSRMLSSVLVFVNELILSSILCQVTRQPLGNGTFANVKMIGILVVASCLLTPKSPVKVYTQ